jgi:hypothetical protein
LIGDRAQAILGGNSGRNFGGSAMNQPSERDSRRWSWWYLLFLIQFIAVIWPPFYNRVEPSLIGLPFFYWYQLACVILGAILTAIVYFATNAQHAGQR